MKRHLSVNYDSIHFHNYNLLQACLPQRGEVTPKTEKLGVPWDKTMKMGFFLTSFPSHGDGDGRPFS